MESRNEKAQPKEPRDEDREGLLHRIEEKLHAVEEVAQEKLHDLGERLHLTREPSRDDKEPAPKAEASKAGKK